MKEATQTRIALLEQNHKTLMDLFKTYSEENAKQHENILQSLIAMQDKLDKALEKKADKWVEGILKWLGIFIGSGVLAYIGSLIIKAITHLQ